MSEYVTHRRALPPERLHALRDALLSSRYVGRSPLAGTFLGSRGFALLFTREGLPALTQRFAFLGDYLARVLDPRDARGLRPWRERLLGPPPPAPNAWYLNLLLLEAGREVGAHIDATLAGPSGVADAVPQHVSVLYLQVPEGLRGGTLRLARDNRPVGEVHPRPGLLVHFRGELQHEVRPFTGGPPGALRASLVCEQYTFPSEALARLPAFRVQSKAGFAAYLEEHRARAAAVGA